MKGGSFGESLGKISTQYFMSKPWMSQARVLDEKKIKPWPVVCLGHAPNNLKAGFTALTLLLKSMVYMYVTENKKI